MRSCVTSFVFASCLFAVPFAHAQQVEAELIAVLQSDAPQQQKADACIDLARVGTQAAVAPLAALLGDEKLAHMARYGLEPIPAPAVDEALRAALGRLKGRLLVGVIQSVGVRRDAEAADALAKLLGAADAEVAAAAAHALGRIATPAAVAALTVALAKEPAAPEGLLRCAEAAAPGQAAALYDALRAAQIPSHVKMAAVRGAILARGTAAGLPLLLEQLRSEDAALFGVALRTGLELPGPEVPRALAAELGRLPAAKQVCLMAVLGERGDAATVPALLGLARGGTPEARVAAVGALTRLGSVEAVPVLAELACAEDAEVAKAAQAALVGFAGANADAAIVALLDKPEGKLKLVGVELVGRRRIAAALPALLRLAGDADEQLSGASLKVLGDLAGVKELPALLAVLQKTPALAAAERAVAVICARQTVLVPGSVVIQKAAYGVFPDGPSKDVTAKVAELVKAGNATLDISNETFGDAAPGKVKKFKVDYAVNGVARSAVANENASLRLELGAGSVPAAVSEPLLAAYAQAQGAPKLALFRILCASGGSQALALVRAAAADANPELKEAAQRALCDWPSAEVLSDLEKIIVSDPNQKIKILALRGYVKLVPALEAPAAQKLAAMKQAFGWAVRDDERRLVLASLGVAPTPDALAFAASLVGQAGLGEEACQAAVGLAENLAGTCAGPVAAAMERVVKASGNEALLKRAKACLEQAKKAEAEQQAAGDETGFVPLCNGKDLAGWEQRGGAWWSVADGVLTAESTAAAPLASNNHLIWKGGTPGDFELRTDFRLSKSANSGIQLRSEAVADRDTGYQADMNGGGNYVGFIYHPKMHLVGGRGERVTIAADGKRESVRFAASAELQKLYKVEEWNSYRIICRGQTITLYLNGVLATQVVDQRPDTPLQGVITLQLHRGPPMKIEYRNLRIKALK